MIVGIAEDIASESVKGYAHPDAKACIVKFFRTLVVFQCI